MKKAKIRKFIAVDISWQDIEQEAAALVIQASTYKSMNGQERHAFVTKELAKFIDDKIVFTGKIGVFLELIDGFLVSQLLNVLMGLFVEDVFAKLQRDGRV